MKTNTVIILAVTAVGGYIFYTKFLSTPTPLLTANGATVAKPAASTGTTSFIGNLVKSVTGGGNSGSILSSAGSAISGLFGGGSSSGLVGTGSADITGTNLIDSNTTQNQVNAISGGYDPSTGTYSTPLGPTMPTDDSTVYTPDPGDQDFFDALGGNG